MDRETQIINEINELEKKYSELSKIVHVQSPGYYDANSDRNYGFEDFYEQKGSNTQLENITAQIQSLKEELERIRTYHDTRVSNKPEEKDIDKEKVKEEIEEAKKQKIERELEAKKLAENEKKQTFQKVKKAYKNAKEHNFDRFMNAITGKKPNWRQISNYSQKELEYLLKTLQGETHLRQESIKLVEKKKELSEAEKRKIISTRNWDEFVKLLQKSSLLKSQVELAERRGRR